MPILRQTNSEIHGRKSLRAKLIRVIPQPEGLPYYFRQFEFECIECGEHYFRKKCDERTTPYCCDCHRKHDKEKNARNRALKEQQRINQELKKILDEIKEVYDDVDDVCVKNGLNISKRIIKEHIKGKENTDGNND